MPKQFVSLIQRLSGVFIFLISISPVQASLDMGRCCQKRARELLVELNDNPWTVCSIGVAITDPLHQTFNPVNATRAWAIHTCPGYQLSTLDEWLQPLAQWFAPYLALLLLCPVGETFDESDKLKGAEKEKKLKVKKNWRDYLNTVAYWVSFGLLKVTDVDSDLNKLNAAHKILEWVNLLGDPASAIWGGIAQLRMDTWVAKNLWNLRYDDGHRKNMLGVAIMASQTPMTTKMGKSLANEFVIKILHAYAEAAFPRKGQRKAPESVAHFQTRLEHRLQTEDSKARTLFRSNKEPRTIAKQLKQSIGNEQSLRSCLQSIKGGHDSWFTHQESDNETYELEAAIDAVLADKIQGIDREFKFRNSDFATKLEGAVRSILDARIKFVNGILLPVVVHFATTAAAFYQAYQKLGDNDTAHSLAYGALYSWLLIVVVIGNSVAANVNAKVIKREIKEQFTLTGTRVALRNRYANNTEWKCWLTDLDVETALTKSVERSTKSGNHVELVAASSVAFGPRFYCKFLIGQFIGWACVVFFGCCAITISYTTPTVGWGCRSFNHLLYIVLSFIAAALQVLRFGVERRYGKGSPFSIIARVSYVLFVVLNSFTLIGGTILHFTGLYRNYSCSRIFGPSTALLDLAPHTNLHVNNAHKYWYSTGYVAYCAAWTICAFAVVFRKYIQMGIQLRFDVSAT